MHHAVHRTLPQASSNEKDTFSRSLALSTFYFKDWHTTVLSTVFHLADPWPAFLTLLIWKNCVFWVCLESIGPLSLQQSRHDNRLHSFRCQFYFNILMSLSIFFCLRLPCNFGSKEWPKQPQQFNTLAPLPCACTQQKLKYTFHGNQLFHHVDAPVNRVIH